MTEIPSFSNSPDVGILLAHYAYFVLEDADSLSLHSHYVTSLEPRVKCRLQCLAGFWIDLSGEFGNAAVPHRAGAENVTGLDCDILPAQPGDQPREAPGGPLTRLRMRVVDGVVICAVSHLTVKRERQLHV